MTPQASDITKYSGSECIANIPERNTLYGDSIVTSVAPRQKCFSDVGSKEAAN